MAKNIDNMNPLSTNSLTRTHSKEMAKKSGGKKTRKNSDYKTDATQRAAAAKQPAKKQTWPLSVKLVLGVLLVTLVVCLLLRLSVWKDSLLLGYITTLLLGLSCGTLYFIRRRYPAPKTSKLDGVFNAILIVFALLYTFMGGWSLLSLLG